MRECLSCFPSFGIVAILYKSFSMLHVHRYSINGILCDAMRGLIAPDLVMPSVKELDRLSIKSWEGWAELFV